MTTLLCLTCNGELAPQKPGARRKTHEGECTKVRRRTLQDIADKKRREADPEKFRANAHRANKKWRENNKDYQVARLAAWREANRERMAESNLAWQRANREKVIAKLQRQRARLLGAFVEDVDRVTVWERDNGICGICGKPVDPTLPWPEKFSMTLDHVVPLARGGEHSYANAQIAHAICNSRKNDRLAA